MVEGEEGMKEEKGWDKKALGIVGESTQQRKGWGAPVRLVEVLLSTWAAA